MKEGSCFKENIFFGLFLLDRAASDASDRGGSASGGAIDPNDASEIGERANKFGIFFLPNLADNNDDCATGAGIVATTAASEA